MQDNQMSLSGLSHETRMLYVAPTLTVYGSLNELTASGTSNASESVGSTMICAVDFMFNANCGV